MQSGTRNSTGLIYHPGVTVYFNRENPNLWKSPGTILSCESKQILIKYGGTYVRAHPKETGTSQIIQTEILNDNNDQEYDINVNTNEIFDVNRDNDLVFDEIKQLNNNT